MHFWALMKKRFIYFKRDKRGLVCEIVLPIIIILMGMYLTTIKFIKEGKEGVLQPSIIGHSNVVYGSSGNYPLLDSTIQQVFGAYSDNISLNKSNQVTMATFDNELMNNPDRSRFYSVFVDKFDLANKQFNYSCFVNTTAPFDINICLNLMDNVFYKIASSQSSANIAVDVMPMKLTKQIASFENTAKGFIASILVSIAFAFIPASLIVIIVKERENNVKHQQIVSGVSLTAYWLSNLLVDFLKYLIPCFATIGILFMYNVTTFIGSSALSATLSLFVLFGPSMILFTYLFSFMFTSPSKA